MTPFFPKDLRPNLYRALFCIAGILFSLWMFHAYGNDSETHGANLSLYAWLAPQWKAKNGDYGYIWLMIPAACWMIWRNRFKMLQEESKPSVLGVLAVVACLVLHVIGFRSQLPRLSIASMAGLFFAIPYAIYGWKVVQWIVFPCAYILLCFTGSILSEFTMPLRKISSMMACFLFHGIGIEAVQIGTVISSNAGGGFQFEVADACSGLRSLLVMTALAAPYAYYTLSTNGKRLLLFVCSIPLAMLANTLRIFTIGVIAEWIGLTLAMQLYHDMSGFIVFVISILLLKGTGDLFEKDWKKILCDLLPKKSSRG